MARKHPDAWERLISRHKTRSSERREEILNESLQQSRNQDGFTQMPPLCISDPYRDGSSKTTYKSTTFLTTKRSDYFSPIQTPSDPYQDPGIDAKLQRQKSRMKMLKDVKPFRPSSARTHSTKVVYNSIVDKDADKEEIKRLIQQNKHRNVRGKRCSSQPRNFVTAWPKRGPLGVPGTLLGGHLPHLPDPYDPPRKGKKVFQDKVPFRPGGKHRVVVAAETKHIVRPASAPAVRKPAIDTKPFRPGKSNTSGRNSTIGAYPEYMPEPMAEPRRRKYVSSDETARWVPSSYPRTRPIRSIALNRRNL